MQQYLLIILTRPLASRTPLFTLRAVGVNRVTSARRFLICGLASIVALLPDFTLSSLDFNGGFTMLGGALNTLAFNGLSPVTPGGGGKPGGGILGNAPGGRMSRGGTTPENIE